MLLDKFDLTFRPGSFYAGGDGRYVERGAGDGQHLSFVVIGQDAVVADAYEPRRQEVEAEALEEIHSIQLHFLLLAAVPIVLVAEGDISPGNIDESVVEDGGFMGVSPQAFNDIFRSTERSFCVDDPVLPLASVPSIRRPRPLPYSLGIDPALAIQPPAGDDAMHVGMQVRLLQSSGQ